MTLIASNKVKSKQLNSCKAIRNNYFIMAFSRTKFNSLNDLDFTMNALVYYNSALCIFISLIIFQCIFLFVFDVFPTLFNVNIKTLFYLNLQMCKLPLIRIPFVNIPVSLKQEVMIVCAKNYRKND